MRLRIFDDEVLWRLGGFPVTMTMLASVLASVLVVAYALVTASAVRHRPTTRLASAGRITYRFVSDLVRDSAGAEVPGLETFSGTLFLFVVGAALIGQLPVIPTPTATLAATSALAVLVFLAVPIAGVRARGVRGYLASYFRPNPVLFPLHLISEVSRTLALALRLFGNMMSGQLVVAVVVALVGVLVPVPLMALDLLIGCLQAYIFTILASVYIGAATQIESGAAADPGRRGSTSRRPQEAAS
ncbi:MAG TPA: F0F1 ATP synthase subunit A [Propionibacteriaceae bacterium]|nr:F0F1 ATP synthase subunit A [Propionibacteriaceae bacterium]